MSGLFDNLYSHLPGYPCAWSPDPEQRYRYTLWRVWDANATRIFQVIGLNPSTADETENDPTVRRCIAFSKRMNCHALVMTNAFAFRATEPSNMKAAADPVGPENDEWLVRCAKMATIVVAAWGVHGNFQDRDRQVKQLIPELLCFGTTKEGHPKHPLYLPSAAELIQFP